MEMQSQYWISNYCFNSIISRLKDNEAIQRKLIYRWITTPLDLKIVIIERKNSQLLKDA